MIRTTSTKPDHRRAVMPMILAGLAIATLSGCGSSSGAIIQAIEDRLSSESPGPSPAVPLAGQSARATPQPSISATLTEPPASDEVARFAAAIETFEAYLAALTLLDFSDPTTFDASLAYRDDDSAARDRALYEEYHRRGFNSTGTLSVVWVDGTTDHAGTEAAVELTSCILVTERSTTVDGITTAEPDVTYLSVTQLIADDRGEFGYLITESSVAEPDGSC